MIEKIVEVLLFASSSPLSLGKLTRFTNSSKEEILRAITALNESYEATGRTFRIQSVAGGYQLYTLPQYNKWLQPLLDEDKKRRRLSPASLETLAIIVYNQPITKPEIEAIRGVDSSGPLMTLLERGLIRTKGRAKRPGHPLLYVSSKEFLRYFGLNSLDDLPKREELEELFKSGFPEKG